MGVSGYISPAVAAGLLIVYFLLSIQAYLSAYALGTFELSYWKFSPTELRMLLVAGNIALLYRPVASLFGYRFLLFDVGGVIGTAGMSLMLIASGIRNTRALYRAETLPEPSRRPSPAIR
jgi:archaetidylinositol phosphate synthase